MFVIGDSKSKTLPYQPHLLFLLPYCWVEKKERFLFKEMPLTQYDRGSPAALRSGRRQAKGGPRGRTG